MNSNIVCTSNADFSKEIEWSSWSTSSFLNPEFKNKNFEFFFTVDKKKYPEDFIFSDLIDLFFYHKSKMNFTKKENNSKLSIHYED